MQSGFAWDLRIARRRRLFTSERKQSLVVRQKQHATVLTSYICVCVCLVREQCEKAIFFRSNRVSHVLLCNERRKEKTKTVFSLAIPQEVIIINLICLTYTCIHTIMKIWILNNNNHSKKRLKILMWQAHKRILIFNLMKNWLIDCWRCVLLELKSNSVLVNL